MYFNETEHRKDFRVDVRVYVRVIVRGENAMYGRKVGTVSQFRNETLIHAPRTPKYG